MPTDTAEHLQYTGYTFGIPICSPFREGWSGSSVGVNGSITVVESRTSWPARLSVNIIKQYLNFKSFHSYKTTKHALFNRNAMLRNQIDFMFHD